MSKRYEPQNIEKKWQKIWQDEKAFAATDDYTKPKYYALVEFPYPSHKENRGFGGFPPMPLQGINEF